MKFLSFLFAVVLALSFAVNSFAVDLENPESIPAEPIEKETEFSQPENEYLNMVLDGMQNNLDDLNEKVEVLEDELSQIDESNSVSVPTDENVVSEEIPEINPDTDLPVDISLMSVAPVTPEDTSGLKAVLLSVIGDYDPVVVEYRYQNSNQTSYQYLREVMPDYPWCASFLMLALFVYCIFRLGGALID